MTTGVGGLQTALILIGFIVRVQPNFNNNIEVYDVRLENLGFYACQLDIKESKFDYTIQKLCLGVLRINKKFVEYGSFKNFDHKFPLNDLEQKNLHSIVDKCDNVNSAYENFESEFISVINKHAPI